MLYFKIRGMKINRKIFKKQYFYRTGWGSRKKVQLLKVRPLRGGGGVKGRITEKKERF